MQSDLASYLPQDDPAIKLWNKIDEEFQIGDTIIIYVEADRPDIRDPDVLKEMDLVVYKIDRYEYDKGEHDGIFSVRSLASLIKAENAKPTSPGGLGGLGRFEIPEDENIISSYLARSSIQLSKGILYTDTYRIAVIVLQLAENADYQEILYQTKKAIEERGTKYSKMTITGTVAMQYAVQENSMENMVIIFPVALIFISIVLFFFHRTFKGIIIAFLPPAYAMALTFGFLGIVQPELTIIAISIVALLMGLGVDYSIHLMNRFGEEKTFNDKIERIEKTLNSTGKAVLLSTITTMIGFGSLMISSMPPIITFGLACAVGILFCFISAMILVPCLVLILKFEKESKIPIWKKFANFALNNRHRVIFIACFFAIISLVVLPQIKTDVNFLDLAPEGITELEKLQEYSENFGGGTNFNALLVETSPQGLTYPEVLEAIYEMEEEIRKMGVTAYSIADEIIKINKLLERKTIVQTLGEFLGVERIIYDKIASTGLIDEDFSKTIIYVAIPVEKGISEIEEIVENINSIASSTDIPHNGRVSQLTGQDAINIAINKRLTDEQTRSLIIAIILVLASLIVIFNSTLYGFLTMIPVGFVLVWEPGFLVALDIPLSVVTISIASIMIGIGIDYGVHITQRVREGLDEGLSRKEATVVAIERTGLSLVEAASTTIAGLISIYIVNIPALQQFGLIVIVMTALSCIAAALILPLFFNLKIIKK
jgi:hydrophobe/amphiphile efflux-3 (HAE3) family protein